VVVHPAFCRGLLEIKTSMDDLKGFEQRLRGLFDQYLASGPPRGTRPFVPACLVMGIVIHDPDPAAHSAPDWLDSTPIHHYRLVGHCPIFILFKKVGEDYEPYEPGIEAMIKAIFRSGWQHATRDDRLGWGSPYI
jgi:hypothetical protein